MPNPRLSEKNKGKSFSTIAKEIQDKYEDRYDPISQKGLMAEMGSLREEQEYQKAKQAITEGLEQILQQTQDPNATINPLDQAPVDTANNMGVGIPDVPQEQGQFQREASKSYNQQFATGGPFKSINTLPSSGFESTMEDAPVAAQGMSPMRLAPLAGNLYNIFSARKPIGNQQRLSQMGYETSVDPNIATRTTPRQTQFSNVDMTPIERGIQDQARGFTGQNINVSGGDAGAFRANELGNQTNVMNAIAQARMQGQQMDQRTEAMNAQEQARIDQFRQQQAQTEAGIRGQNIGMGMQLSDLDARDTGAFQTFRSQNIGALTENIGNIGREQDMMDMISQSLGYNSFGQYMENVKDPRKKQGIMDTIKNILSSR